MENVGRRFGPDDQSVCPVSAGHLQQAWPEREPTDLRFKAPAVLFVRIKKQMSSVLHLYDILMLHLCSLQCIRLGI